MFSLRVRLGVPVPSYKQDYTHGGRWQKLSSHILDGPVLLELRLLDETYFWSLGFRVADIPFL